MTRTFLIDTDTASDDAVALIMALGAPDVRVAAITTVAGNVNLLQATRNALFTVELCEAHVSVYVGAAKPLLRAHEDATWFHGGDGLGDHGYQPSRREPEAQPAAEAIIDTIEANEGLVLVTLGPLTNIALALAKEPDIAGKVSRCVVMGGAPCCEGNVTPAAEFNIWVDPEAARSVFHSRLTGAYRLAARQGRGGAESCRNRSDLSMAERTCALRHRKQQLGAASIQDPNW